jgi:hypothetical protein
MNSEGDVMGATSLALDFLWGFMEPILSDAFKERLKPKGSIEKAKERAFHLYDILGEVSDYTERFVMCLESLVNFRSSGSEMPKDTIPNLVGHAELLMDKLPELAYALDAVNPQLEIHQNSLVQDINRYRHSRAQLLCQLEVDSYGAASESADSLQQYLKTAEANRDLIVKSVAVLRTFLAEEFAFKDSF